MAELERNEWLEVVKGDFEGVIAVKDLSFPSGKSPNARIGDRQQHRVVMVFPVGAADEVEGEVVEGIARRPTAKRACVDVGRIRDFL